MSKKSRGHVKKSKAIEGARYPLKYKIAPDRLPKYRDYKPIFGFLLYLHKLRNWSFECLQNKKEFLWVFERFKGISNMTWEEIVKAPMMNAHDVKWTLETLPEKVKRLPQEWKNFPLFQFKVFKECRIFGLFDQKNVFQVLFLDRNHKIYP